MPPDVITAGAVVLGVLFTLATTAGVYSVYRVNKQATTVAEYKGMAERAQENAKIWEDRSRATQAELDSAVRDLGEAQTQIVNLRSQVAHLEGVVTARAEITELVRVVTGLAQTVQTDHAAMRSTLGLISTHLGVGT